MAGPVNFGGGAACVCALVGCVTGAAADGGPAYIERPPSATLAREGVWRPAAGVELAVRVRCVGQGMDRACRLHIARAGRDGGAEELLADEACGAAIPAPGVDSDRTVLVLVGEDGRGGWRQAARFIAERNAIQWTRRRYDDGL
jgi:hypothetical protein